MDDSVQGERGRENRRDMENDTEILDQWTLELEDAVNGNAGIFTPSYQEGYNE